MKGFLKTSTAAAALLGAAALGAPAQAAYVGVGVGPIGFDIYSGGYCDRWGCPADYWAYPIYYGPIYYDNAWYRGPVYTRMVDGERWYWLHGGWHRDQWRGLRPSWARVYHYGPPLGLDFYREHGFRVSDRDWRAWQNHEYGYRAGYRAYGEDGYYGNEERYPARYRDDDVDRDQYGYDPDRYYDRDTNGPDYDRDRGTYEHSGTYDRDHYYSRDQYTQPAYDRDRQYGQDEYSRTEYGRSTGYEGSEMYDRGHDTYQQDGRSGSDYDRDNEGGGYQRSDYQSSGGASGTGSMHTHSTHTSHAPHRHAQHHAAPSHPDEGGGHQHTGYSDQDHARADDQTREHGNSDPGDQNRSGSENGSRHTNYQPGSERGHAKPPPPVNGQRPQPSSTNPDEEDNGPGN